nr:MAG TPA: hypothetical protein [Caudoviricetes sp.]
MQGIRNHSNDLREALNLRIGRRAVAKVGMTIAIKHCIFATINSNGQTSIVPVPRSCWLLSKIFSTVNRAFIINIDVIIVWMIIIAAGRPMDVYNVKSAGRTFNTIFQFFQCKSIHHLFPFCITARSTVVFAVNQLIYYLRSRTATARKAGECIIVIPFLMCIYQVSRHRQERQPADHRNHSCQRQLIIFIKQHFQILHVITSFYFDGSFRISFKMAVPCPLPPSPW